MIPRILTLPKNHSFFLFGPRGVGKTTLLHHALPRDKTHIIDLLDFDIESRLLKRPKEFSELLAGLPDSIQWVLIDEIQKLPFLLNEVHRHIEGNPKRYFALTGSSARKLKRGQANLLAGRAFVYHLAPLTSVELGQKFDLGQALMFGALPKVIALNKSADKKRFLKSYAQTYLKEEIQSEGIVRNLQGFQRFLSLAASVNGAMLSWSNIAREVGLDAKTIQSYFEITEDTLIGFLLPAFRRSIRKRQRTHPKFYLFDTGVKRALSYELNIPLVPGTIEYGWAFEHFWIIEIMRLSNYRSSDFQFSYFATQDIEIDLVAERPGKPLLFIEIKSSERVSDATLRPLLSVVRDVKNSEGICICREPRKRRIGNVLVCPWQEALNEINLN